MPSNAILLRAEVMPVHNPWLILSSEAGYNADFKQKKSSSQSIMIHRYALTLVLILCVLILSLSGKVVAFADQLLLVHINTNVVHMTIDRRFVCVTLDMGMFVPGAPFWNDPLRSRGPFPFNNVALRALSRQLSPAWLRVGGTTADGTFYNLPGTGNQFNNAYLYVLGPAIIDSLLDFAVSTGYDVLFDVNGGAGPRKGMLNNAWNSANAQALIEYIAHNSNGRAVQALQLGNEPDLYPPLFRVSPSQLANDYAVFYQMIHRIYGTSSVPLVVGPASANIASPFFRGFISQVGRNIDIVDFHFYPLVSFRCAVQGYATVEKAINPLVIDSYAQEVIRAQDIVRQRNYPLWLSESALSVCGGQPGVDDRYVFLLTYLNSLASTAFYGLRVHCHQSLIGSNCKLPSTTLILSPFTSHSLT